MGPFRIAGLKPCATWRRATWPSPPPSSALHLTAPPVTTPP